MPSDRSRPDDERWAVVQRLLAPAGEEYTSALSSAVEEARAVLRTLQSTGNGRVARVAQELGGLSLGPLDPVQFTALLDPAKQVDPLHLERLEEAVSIMEWNLAEVSPVDVVEMDAGIGLRDAVAEAIAERGRAYGAVRTAALLRGGSYSGARDERLLGRLPFRDWRSLERELAPPLVVVVEGRDLDTASGLAEFLDGGQKVVLLVRGPCSPAPLARLIAPGILVAQAGDPEAFERLASFPGPGVAALVPEGAARFVHDPDGNPVTGGTLEVHELPEAPPRMWIGGISPRQQTADLRILERWVRDQETGAAAGAADRPSAGTEGGMPVDPRDRSEDSPPAAPDPAERLAAWLLSRADLDHVEG